MKSPRDSKPGGGGVRTSNPGTWDIESRKSEVQGHNKYTGNLRSVSAVRDPVSKRKIKRR